MSEAIVKVCLTVGLFLAGMAAGAIGAAKHYSPILKQLQSDYDTFKGGVAALGKAAEKRARDTDAANIRRKQDADKENAAAVAGANRLIAKLRDERDRARGSFVPAASPSSRSPDLACFDRIELEQAIRGFVAGIRGLTDEGSKAAIDLNTARIWASAR